MQDLAADASADDARERVSEHAKAEGLEEIAGHVAADGAAGELDEQGEADRSQLRLLRNRANCTGSPLMAADRNCNACGTLTGR